MPIVKGAIVNGDTKNKMFPCMLLIMWYKYNFIFWEPENEG